MKMTLDQIKRHAPAIVAHAVAMGWAKYPARILTAEEAWQQFGNERTLAFHRRRRAHNLARGLTVVGTVRKNPSKYSRN